MSGKLLVGVVAALALTSCATTKYSITPIDTGAAHLSYYNGRPTADLELRNGAVQVTPLGVEVNGRISFAVAAYNKLDVPSNLGPENFRARVGGVWVPVYSYEDLGREAESAATWAAVAVAVTGVATAVAAHHDAHRTVDSTIYTRRGPRHVRTTWYDPASAAAGTAAATVLTAGGLYLIDQELHETLDRLGDTILQTTTVRPQESWGGQIVVGRAIGRAPYDVEIVAHWNGEDYAFRFRVEPR
ncbi:hypothetical protein [Pseudoxanthomonas suwonensis]|uniref:hypothetical protein n=1 Tax=Pseudoxanthomonas suwonensis TaxID=314722 RepID=UPI001FE37CCD|nr:hypothetical protein [Pseudoxanthomonas suwonensis]